MALKVRKSSKSLIFLWFRVLKTHIFARNGQTRSKIDQLNAGPHQIDARGSHATKNFEFWSWCTVQRVPEVHPGHLGDRGVQGDESESVGQYFAFPARSAQRSELRGGFSYSSAKMMRKHCP